MATSGVFAIRFIIRVRYTHTHSLSS
jgi:hypothetical protein